MADHSPATGSAAFDRYGPDRAVTALVVAVPHAGRHYPPEVESDRAVRWAVLEQLEDRYADRLIGPVLAGGAVCLVARHARAWIDLNRAETDAGGQNRSEQSARARAGLGLVPSRLAGRALWRSPPSPAAIGERIAQVHRPYHEAVARALAQARAAHGHAVLIDCHSMPPIGRAGGQAPQLVVGDRHGTSAAAAVTAAVIAAAGMSGLLVARNAPYAGAHTLDRHGRPARDVHALQIEIDRSLYLIGATGEPSAAGVASVGALLAAIAWAATDAAAGSTIAIAAE